MPQGKGKILKYPEEAMAKAIADVRQGVPVSTAAKSNGVPRVTLLYKVRGKTPIERRMGRHSVLTKDEEGIIVQWIITTAKAGFPVTMNQVCDSVQELIREMGRENPFQNDRPGRKWMAAFLKRNPNVSLRSAENLTVSRASISQRTIHSWFDSVEEYLKINCYEDILEDPIRIFNGDETAFFLNPTNNKVLAKKGDKSVYMQVNSDEKECLTVLISANAAGMIVPPLVIYKYERVPRHIAENHPKGWGIGRSESGWMNGEIFFEFMGNIFYPWLINNNIPLPVIFFMDGHVSHLTMHLSNLCREKGIVLVALPPNATHIIQPMDVSVFRTLKEGWKLKVHDWRVNHMENPILKKQHFAELLKEVLGERITASVIFNGFRKCGLFPWNREAVSFSENSENPIQTGENIRSSHRLEKYKICLSTIEEVLGENQILQFSEADSWKGRVEDTSLFNFWKKMKRDIEQMEQSNECHTISVVSAQAGHSKNSETSLIPTGDSSINNVGIQFETETNIDVSSSLPSPFKKAIIWPPRKVEILKPRKRKQEPIPSVITSDDFLRYKENKEKKIQEAEIAKKERAKARLKKKEEKAEELKKKKEERERKKIVQKKTKSKSKKRALSFSSEEESEEWVPSGDSCDDISLNLEKSDEEGGSTNHPIEAGKNVTGMGCVESTEASKSSSMSTIESGHINKITTNEYEKNAHQVLHETFMELSDCSKVTERDEMCDENGYDKQVINKVNVIREGDYCIALLEGKKQDRKHVCQVVRTLSGVEVEVRSLVPRNRLKTVFSADGNIFQISTRQIICKLDNPLAFGTLDKRYQFPEPLSVDGKIGSPIFLCS